MTSQVNISYWFMKMKIKLQKLLASLVLAILFSITCADMGTADNPPPTLTVTDQTFTVSENVDIAGRLATVAVASNPESKPLTYSITTNDNNLFEIDANSGTLRLADGKYLDYEVETSHTITIEVTDGEMSTTATIIFMVENVIKGDQLCGDSTDDAPIPVTTPNGNPLFTGGTGVHNDPWVIPVKAGCEDLLFVFDPDITLDRHQLWFAIDLPVGHYAGYVTQRSLGFVEGERPHSLLDFYDVEGNERDDSLSARLGGANQGFSNTNTTTIAYFNRGPFILTERGIRMQYQTDEPDPTLNSFFHVRGFGLRKLNNVTGLRGNIPSTTSVNLSWTERSESYINGVVITWTLSDGMPAPAPTAEGATEQPVIVAKGTNTTTITGLTTGTAYKFTVKSRDMIEGGLVLSSGISITATPQ